MVTLLDGSSLTVDELLRLGVQEHPEITIDAQARARVADSAVLVNQVVRRRAVYGRTTGVGANRDTTISGNITHDLRLLRSHATSSGEVLDPVTTRMAMIVRLNQLLHGGSGMHPGILDALAIAIRENRIPVVHAAGAIGTGDLSAMAEIALGLAGETTLRDGSRRPLWRPTPGDSLPIISTNAVTIASTCQVLGQLRRWITHHTVAAGLSFIAVRASAEPLQPSVQEARPHPGQVRAAAELRTLLSGIEFRAARVQDSYGFRAYPQVAGALLDSLDGLERVLVTEANAAAENPLIDLAAHDVFHNGNFHGISVALAVDHVKLALSSLAQLSVARVTDLSSPEMTGLPAFLADGTPGSSGMMLLEYNQAAAQAALRQSAQPATLGSVVISRGTENHSSFSTQAARQLHQCLESATDVLACELLAAIRALDLRNERLPGTGHLSAYLRRIGRELNHDLADRSLTTDLATVRHFLTADQ
ncbi:histidine ammonia-lyase [Saccharopolyspora shandongensis]|uniref:Histidine ammonia-lyase n=1 Tax=Saccharopolyspora shandongensis TaxID=418495 RepID=A0A1H3Q2U6_9PSEU|nr:aromatic amino acid ammonia-lyase [Saccharopolyspora shandongensis]SDZ07069.1 histidine ammonia-lyase [Saccharopolyspora shandongensis]